MEILVGRSQRTPTSTTDVPVDAYDKSNRYRITVPKLNLKLFLIDSQLQNNPSLPSTRAAYYLSRVQMCSLSDALKQKPWFIHLFGYNGYKLVQGFQTNYHPDNVQFIWLYTNLVNMAFPRMFI